MARIIGIYGIKPDGDIVACGSQDNSVHFWRRSTGMDAEMTGYPGNQVIFLLMTAENY